MELFQVDSFTAERFSGNPAAVVLLDAPRDDEWLQAVAAEMNLAETAFVAAGEGHRGLRWFTPIVEVDLCGHATLAAAHVLFEQGVTDDPIRFATRSGELTVRQGADGLEMDFPSRPPRPVPIPESLGAVIGVQASAAAGFERWLLAEVDSEATLRGISPSRDAVLSLDCDALVVTAPPGNATPADFVSRCFAPAYGIDEDPVTGSAHCLLGPYWSARLGKDELVGYQASRRGGTVGVRMAGERVVLLGNAVTVFRTSID